ncbi:MAG: NTP transferase domain-containing protein [Flavobacteriales bacterium]|nr:NTP transferase domain-containing protein [Flavobacteriales bacterium]
MVVELIPKGIPQFPKTDQEAFLGWIGDRLRTLKVALKGLVLAGGKSTRMGFDKGGIVYSEKDQRNRTADLLAPFCEEVFISCRRKQLDVIESAYPLLADTYLGLGPYGAILSAFRRDPDAAWLVVACDLPFLNSGAIGELVSQRAANTYATAFYNKHTDFPDPLCTIWEPRAYRRMLEFLSLGVSCPRKVLINSEIKLVSPLDPHILTNVNTPEEFEQTKKLIQNKE